MLEELSKALDEALPLSSNLLEKLGEFLGDLGAENWQAIEELNIIPRLLEHLFTHMESETDPEEHISNVIEILQNFWIDETKIGFVEQIKQFVHQKYTNPEVNIKILIARMLSECQSEYQSDEPPRLFDLEILKSLLHDPHDQVRFYAWIAARDHVQDLLPVQEEFVRLVIEEHRQSVLMNNQELQAECCLFVRELVGEIEIEQQRLLGDYFNELWDQTLVQKEKISPSCKDWFFAVVQHDHSFAIGSGILEKIRNALSCDGVSFSTHKEYVRSLCYFAVDGLEVVLLQGATLDLHVFIDIWTGFVSIYHRSSPHCVSILIVLHFLRFKLKFKPPKHDLAYEDLSFCVDDSLITMEPQEFTAYIDLRLKAWTGYSEFIKELLEIVPQCSINKQQTLMSILVSDKGTLNDDEKWKLFELILSLHELQDSQLSGPLWVTPGLSWVHEFIRDWDANQLHDYLVPIFRLIENQLSHNVSSFPDSCKPILRHLFNVMGDVLKPVFHSPALRRIIGLLSDEEWQKLGCPLKGLDWRTQKRRIIIEDNSDLLHPQISEQWLTITLSPTLTLQGATPFLDWTRQVVVPALGGIIIEMDIHEPNRQLCLEILSMNIPVVKDIQISFTSYSPVVDESFITALVDRISGLVHLKHFGLKLVAGSLFDAGSIRQLAECIGNNRSLVAVRLQIFSTESQIAEFIDMIKCNPIIADVNLQIVESDESAGELMNDELDIVVEFNRPSEHVKRLLDYFKSKRTSKAALKEKI